MSLTIKKVPTVLSIHQMDEEEDPKFAGAVRRSRRARGQEAADAHLRARVGH